MPFFFSPSAITEILSVSFTRNSATPGIWVVPSAAAAATDKIGYSSIIEAARMAGTVMARNALDRTRISATGSPPSTRSFDRVISPPISCNVRIRPVRCGFIPIAGKVMSLPFVISAATMAKAADDGSRGTRISAALNVASPVSRTICWPSSVISWLTSAPK